MRRKWMDAVISQYDKHLDALIDVNKALVQRNSLLRYFAARSFDAGMLAPWDTYCAQIRLIAAARRTFIADFLPNFLQTYEEISRGAESVGLELTTQISGDADDIQAQMSAAEMDDRRLRRTTVGVHKDDVVFRLGDYPMKRFGSQGQQKSYLVSLRLAQLSFIEEATEVKPILLLDDIFDKMDEKRAEALLSRVTNGTFGQVFITDTHLGRVPALFEATGADVGCLKFIKAKSPADNDVPMKRRRPPLRNSADYERQENSSRPLAEVIQHFLRISSMQGKLDEVEVKEAWKEVFGPAVEIERDVCPLQRMGHCYACWIAGRSRRSFNMESKKILNRLNEHLGRAVIQRVRIL